MSNKNSVAPDKVGDTAKAEQTSTHSRDAVERRRINVPLVQNVLLIWLDNNIDDSSADCHNTITQLRCAINTINIFTVDGECIHFLESMNDEKACMIISGSVGQLTVSRVHNMPQVDSIFIFCGDTEYHEQWIKEWSKIKGVFTEISSICDGLKKAAQEGEHNAIPMSFMTTSDDVLKKNLDQLDPSYMYTQIFKEILLTIKFEQQHITRFIEYCREVLVDNEGELKNVKKLERKYRDETPIWWYTCGSFLYAMLNRALRVIDVDIIIKMVFFIGDLHRHIEQLHKEQFGGHHSNKSFTVYRGQGMSKADFEQLTKTKGGLMSFNNFLSTSKDREVSLFFAESNSSNPDLVGILFVMTIDSSKSTTPFASIIDVSYFKKEEEVLFAMHTVFRIGNIIPMDENHRLFQVELTLTSDNDKDLRVLTDRIREETFPKEEGWYRLGKLLVTMGQTKKAEQVYNILLEQTMDVSKTGYIYRLLGWAKADQGEYKEAITFCKQSIEIYKKTLPSNGPDLGGSYNTIGVVYDNMGEYSKALSSHEKALKIRQQSLPSNHPDLAKSYGNIGLVYDEMGEYSSALANYEKALEIWQQSLPPNHPDLASFYNNIGNVYLKIGDYPKALSSHERALATRQLSLPPNHPDLGGSYNNLGIVCRKMGDYSKALSYYEKALEIEQPSLPPNHPSLGSLYSNIGMLYENMRDYSKALWSHEKAYEIRQQVLPRNHPDLAAGYVNFGSVYESMGNYSEAHSFYKRAVDIAQQSLPANHPNLQKWRNNLDRVKKKL